MVEHLEIDQYGTSFAPEVRMHMGAGAPWRVWSGVGVGVLAACGLRCCLFAVLPTSSSRVHPMLCVVRPLLVLLKAAPKCLAS